ncbi:MAG: hypothetical protein AB1498_02540 [bacterium]
MPEDAAFVIILSMTEKFHSIWSGLVSFGLVNIPVELYSASKERPLELSYLHKKDLSPLDYTIKTIYKRISEKGDLWKGVLEKGIDMKSCLDRLPGFFPGHGQK